MRRYPKKRAKILKPKSHALTAREVAATVYALQYIRRLHQGRPAPYSPKRAKQLGYNTAWWSAIRKLHLYLSENDFPTENPFDHPNDEDPDTDKPDANPFPT